MAKKEKLMTLKLSRKDKAQLKNLLANVGIRAESRKRMYKKKYPKSELLPKMADITLTNSRKFLNMLAKGKFR